MISYIYPLLIFTIIVVSFLNAFILITSKDYVNDFKVSKGKINFIQTFKLNLKIFNNSLLSERRTITFGEFFSRLVLYTISIFLVVEMVMGNGEVEKHSILLLFFFFILSKGIEFFYMDKDINLTKYLNIATTCLIFFTITYGLSTLVLERVTDIGISLVVIKLVVFLNIILIVYITEFLMKNLKNKKNIVDEIYSKLIFYFLMISIFVYLNSFAESDQSPFKYFYYTISIILIEFMSAYVRKNIGKINENQVNIFIYRYWLIFVAFSFLLIIGSQHVI